MKIILISIGIKRHQKIFIDIIPIMDSKNKKQMTVTLGNFGIVLRMLPVSNIEIQTFIKLKKSKKKNNINSIIGIQENLKISKLNKKTLSIQEANINNSIKKPKNKITQTKKKKTITIKNSINNIRKKK